jgi:hypothetical protein
MRKSNLYHVSGWADLSEMSVGESFILNPGRQCAEGLGVYFAEGATRVSAAEGCQGNPVAVVAIEAPDSAGWWQSKAAKARKFGKPRTWHSDGKHVACTVEAIDYCSEIPVLRCTWAWAWIA